MTDALTVDRRLPLLIFTIAMVVKGSVLWSLWSHPLLQPAGEMDSNVYLMLARDGVPPVPYFVSPFYLYFLKATGASIAAARIAQILLGSLAVVLQFLTAARWFGQRGALITAAVSLLTGVVTFNEVTILQSAVDPFLLSLTLYSLTAALQRGFMRAYAAAGASAALFALNRPNALVWIALIALLLALQKRSRHAVTLLLGCAIVLTPVAVRNYAVARELVLISSHGGLNFYIGNNETADGTYQAIRGIRPTIQGQATDSKAMAERSSGRSLSSSEVSRWFYRQSLEWITANPSDAALLFLKKLALCFHQTDLALNHSYSFFTQDVVSPLRFLFVGAWLIVPLGFAGITARWRDRIFLTFVAFVPVYAASVALFFVSSRYRLPLLVALTICAAGVVHIRRAGVIVLLIAASIALFPFALTDGRALEQTNMVALQIERGEFEEAERLLARYMPEHPEPSRLKHRAAIAYLSAREPLRAIPLFESVRRDGEAQPVLRESSTDELLRIYVETGRASEARSLLASIDPGTLGPRRAQELGRLALDLRESRRAVAFLQTAVARDAAQPKAWQLLGIALLAENEPKGAVAALERSRSMASRDLDTLLFLGVAHAKLGDLPTARAFAQEALRIDPTFAGAKMLLEEVDAQP